MPLGKACEPLENCVTRRNFGSDLGFNENNSGLEVHYGSVDVPSLMGPPVRGIPLPGMRQCASLPIPSARPAGKVPASPSDDAGGALRTLFPSHVRLPVCSGNGTPWAGSATTEKSRSKGSEFGGPRCIRPQTTVILIGVAWLEPRDSRRVAGGSSSAVPGSEYGQPNLMQGVILLPVGPSRPLPASSLRFFPPIAAFAVPL